MNREAERQRLVELVKSAPYGTGTLGEYFNKSYIENCIVQHLLDNGVIVPPVKVGDTIYYIGGITNRIIYDVTVEEIYFGDAYAFNVSSGYSNFTLLQSEVYFTREEAEAKLKEGVGE